MRPSNESRLGAATDPTRLVSRIYRMRALGLGTGFLVVASGLYQNGASPLTWALLAANAFVWPTVAYFIARRSAEPERAELRNLAIDSAMGGVWVAMMEFNLLPSALIVVMLSADKIGVGGWRLLWRTATLQVVACGATAALLGFPFQPQSNMLTIVLSLPFMFVYPLAISATAYSLARKVVKQNRLLERLNRTDGLTGLVNRVTWEETARVELTRAARAQRTSALLMLDIDDFKQINDRYGHPVGDTVLRHVAEALRSHLREVDTPGRFGGDEFGAVLVDIERGDALALAERIRAAIESARFDDVPSLRFTVSLGVAMSSGMQTDTTAWIRRADAALYRAKQHGRNRVVVRSDNIEEPVAA